MTTSVRSTIRVSFDAEDGGVSPVSPVNISYMPEYDFVRLEQGADVIVLPFKDAADFVAILRGWVEGNK